MDAAVGTNRATPIDTPFKGVAARGSEYQDFEQDDDPAINIQAQDCMIFEDGTVLAARSSHAQSTTTLVYVP